MNLIQKAINLFDYYLNRNECFVASKNDLETCMKIRETVFGEELKRTGGQEGAAPAIQDEFDAHSTHVACRDKKTAVIVGVVRFTSAVHYADKEEYVREYGLHHFPPEIMDKVAVASRLAILKEYRKGLGGFLLAMECYKNAFKDFRISVIVCEPGLYPMYRRLGYRPLDRVHQSPFGGYRLPLYLVVHDYDHLERFKSPFLGLAKSFDLPVCTEGLEWQQKYIDKNGLVSPGFTPLREDDGQECYSIITHGLSDEGQKSLLHHAISISCQYGDLVIRQGSGDRNLGFVKKGALEVRQGEKLITMLGEGDIFGEIAFILNIPRTADVIAASPDTEIILLSLSSIEKLRDPKDRELIWKNLSSLLAQRLTTKK